MNRYSGKTRLAFYAAETITGSCRDINEDAFAVYEESEVFVVADGAGGVGFTGAKPAKIAVEAFRGPLSGESDCPQSGLLNADPMVENILRADTAIRRLVDEDSRAEGTGAAVVSGQLTKGWIRIVHIGDCRAGVLRGGTLTWLTNDHSLSSELRRTGASEEEIKRAEECYPTVITRILGPLGTGSIDITYQPLESGDLLLLCSDGLFRQVDHPTITRLVGDTDKDLTIRCSNLLASTEKAGGKDNATVILLEVR